MPTFEFTTKTVAIIQIIKISVLMTVVIIHQNVAKLVNFKLKSLNLQFYHGRY